MPPLSLDSTASASDSNSSWDMFLLLNEKICFLLPNFWRMP